MVIAIDDMSGIPIYLQIRNQIIEGISKGLLQPGESLPSIRAMAEETGINSMTVNKSYQILKQEGYLVIDRRKGARIATSFLKEERLSLENKEQLRRMIAEAMISGMTKEQFFAECNRCFEELGGNEK